MRLTNGENVVVCFPRQILMTCPPDDARFIVESKALEEVARRVRCRNFLLHNLGHDQIPTPICRIFSDKVFQEVLRYAETSEIATRLASIALLAPEDDGDFNTERLVIETKSNVGRSELRDIKYTLRTFPVLKRREMGLDVYEVIDRQAFLTPGSVRYKKRLRVGKTR